jgi:signal transduction histidine kinase
VTRRSIRDAVLGAVLGGTAAWTSLWLASTTSRSAPLVVLVVLVITLVGLSLGAIPALIAYVVAGVILLAGSLPPPGETMADADVLRLMVFAFGSPIVIVLGLRSEWQQRANRAARQASSAAEELANEASLAADAARLEVRDALELVDRERERLAEVAQAIPEPLIVYGADGLGTFANNAALRVFGRSFYDRPPDQWARVVEPRDEGGRPLPRAAWPQPRARSGSLRRRVLVRLPMSGRDLLVEVEGTPLPDGGAVLLLRDVGKEVDERRRLSRFASFVAHELRNPLAVAKARIELANRGREAVRGVDHGARALESVDAAIGILERLELFSRAEAGRLEAAQDPFDLREAADAGIERLRALGSERAVRVIAHGAPAVLGDRGLTEQAITNLLTNADRYSQPGTPIDVEIDGREAPLLRVRDAGPGIADDVAHVLFRERVGSGRGLGLGLFLVNAAMQAQGGSVRLEERRPRASFVLAWPRSAATGDGGEAEPPIVSA